MLNVILNYALISLPRLLWDEESLLCNIYPTITKIYCALQLVSKSFVMDNIQGVKEWWPRNWNSFQLLIEQNEIQKFICYVFNNENTLTWIPTETKIYGPHSAMNYDAFSHRLCPLGCIEHTLNISGMLCGSITSISIKALLILLKSLLLFQFRGRIGIKLTESMMSLFILVWLLLACDIMHQKSDCL